MIRFACTCHTILEVSDEFAGTSLQCPKCKRLLDVPTLSELKGIDEEGTYKLDALKLPDEPDRLANLQRAYAPQRVDHQGQQIDLRETFKGDANAMDDDDVLEIMDAEPVSAPSTIPETGELVSPFRSSRSRSGSIPPRCRWPRPSSTTPRARPSKSSTAGGSSRRSFAPGTWR